MSRFYVGQRVRLIYSRPHLHVDGKRYAKDGDEGRICRGHCYQTGDDWEVDWGFCKTTVLSDQIEPILPDGHQACDKDFKRDLDKLLERQGVAA